MSFEEDLEEKTPKIKLISVKMPTVFVEMLDDLVRCGLYPSRSMAVRTAVRDLLKREHPKWNPKYIESLTSRAAKSREPSKPPKIMDQEPPRIDAEKKLKEENPPWMDLWP